MYISFYFYFFIQSIFRFIHFYFVRRKNSLCAAKLKRKPDTNGNGYEYVQSNGHNHLLDTRDKEVDEFKAKLKKLARTTGKENREIVAEAEENVSVGALAILPQYNTLAATIRNTRSAMNKGKAPTPPTAPRDVSELILPVEYTKIGDDPFMIYDSGPSKKRIIMFAAERSLDFLSSCTEVQMDGTFAVCPNLFNQLYTIHGE